MARKIFIDNSAIKKPIQLKEENIAKYPETFLGLAEMAHLINRKTILERFLEECIDQKTETKLRGDLKENQERIAMVFNGLSKDVLKELKDIRDAGSLDDL